MHYGGNENIPITLVIVPLVARKFFQSSKVLYLDPLGLLQFFPYYDFVIESARS